MKTGSNLYAGGTLDRAATLRKDSARIRAMLHDTRSRLLPIRHSLTLIDGPDSESPRLGRLSNEAGSTLISDPRVAIAFLGLDDGTPWFALDVSELEAPDNTETFIELRAVGALLPAPEAALAAYARGLTGWHQRHRHCGVCGHPTESRDAGHTRQCLNRDCGIQHFPRTDPAVIMLVEDGERCLLGRQPRFPPGLYSTLAGFVEPGESLEEAVIREVFEETGVHVTDIRYHSSQPWPFPASLMLGFTARATSSAITVQAEEMEDARWFDRAAVRAAAKGNEPCLRLPRTDSISRRLITDWLAES
ncbi:MAG: NAD(+) diphosphatase [Rhodospirillaceae bacterium]